MEQNNNLFNAVVTAFVCGFLFACVVFSIIIGLALG